MPKTVLITGANRGIGASLASRFLTRGDNVIAAVRTPSDPSLASRGFSRILPLDLSSDTSISAFLESIKDTKIDVAVLNAGVLNRDSLDSPDISSNCAHSFRVNATAPLMLAQGLRGCLSQGSLIVMMTSRMGSIADNGSGGYYSYRASKAALNAISKSLALDYANEGVVVCLLHPGMGDDVEVATEGLMKRIDEANLENSGVFFHRDGQVLPW